MTKTIKANTQQAMLVIIDVQQAFMEPVKKMKSVVKKTTILAQAANLLSLPIIVSEQYPKGLGHTVEPLASELGNHILFEKTTFSCMGQPGIQQVISSTNRQQVIIAGVETHVCVLQTALDLLEAGKEVFIVEDAVSSRNSNDKKIALARLAQSGAIITSTEAILLELIGDSRHEQFKSIQALIK